MMVAIQDILDAMHGFEFFLSMDALSLMKFHLNNSIFFPTLQRLLVYNNPVAGEDLIIHRHIFLEAGFFVVSQNLLDYVRHFLFSCFRLLEYSAGCTVVVKVLPVVGFINNNNVMAQQLLISGVPSSLDEIAMTNGPVGYYGLKPKPSRALILPEFDCDLRNSIAEFRRWPHIRCVNIRDYDDASNNDEDVYEYDDASNWNQWATWCNKVHGTSRKGWLHSYGYELKIPALASYYKADHGYFTRIGMIPVDALLLAARHSLGTGRSSRGRIIAPNRAPYIQFLLDSGASTHVVGDAGLLCGFRHLPRNTGRFATLPDGSRRNIIGVGATHMDGFSIPNVYLVDGLAVNLVSVSRLTKNHGICCCFYGNRCQLIKLADGIKVGEAVLNGNGVYGLRFLRVPDAGEQYDRSIHRS